MTVIDDMDQDTLNILRVCDRKGELAVTIGPVATVFFEEPWSKEKRGIVAEVARLYMEMVGGNLRWAEHTKSSKMHPIGSGRVAPPWEWLPQRDEVEEPWWFGFKGGTSKDAASPFLVCAYGSDTIRRGLGYFRIALPLLWYADRSGSLPKLLLSICERLKPASGYGGFGILESSDMWTEMAFQRTVRELAERFPGLDADASPITSSLAHDGIKGVNWLTVLGEHWIKEVGGLTALMSQLDESFHFYRYNGGVIIQAGPKPQLGDARANIWPAHYVALAKVLKTIQMKNHYPMHFGGTGGFDHESTMAWLNRFDRK